MFYPWNIGDGLYFGKTAPGGFYLIMAFWTL